MDDWNAKPSLETYIPIGCLHFVASDFLCSGSAQTSSWSEVTEDFVIDNLEDLRQELAPLISASWLRVFRLTGPQDPEQDIWRIYVLPEDVARASIDRNSRNLSKALKQVLPRIDTSAQTWKGQYWPSSEVRFDPWAAPEHLSLFYIFNTLPSPSPEPGKVKNRYYRDAIQRMLDGGNPFGLRTCLYPYQRRSAAMMLQREVQPQMQLDPRFECRGTPTGQRYYFGARDGVFIRHPRLYEQVRGGILAETMGLGKTLICITAILTTKGQCPTISPHHKMHHAKRESVGSLATMAAAKLSRNPIPWRTAFELLAERRGEEMSACISVMEHQRPSYEIPPRVVRDFRKSSSCAPAEQVLLSSATIIVVPPNLVGQWRSELSKHVEHGALSVLVPNSSKDLLPPPEELCQYDVLLFSRTRFEAENKSPTFDRDGSQWNGYTSPLKDIHWLRIIVDEGHGFSSGNSNAALMAEKFVRAERRWIVSGTPAKDLLGVEVELPAMELSSADNALQNYRHQSLEQRRYFDGAQEQASGAVKRLGALASRFLKVQPWSGSDADSQDRAAIWDEYVFRHEHAKLRTYFSFSKCLRSALENLVIKTQPVDVERDLILPPLRHSIVRLRPSTFDKMTANLFVLLYTANAITSERTDQDYLFHRASRGHLQRLTQNLRQSAFFWVGFNTASVTASLNTAEKYLDKPETNCASEDRALMRQTMDVACVALVSPVWSALGESQEMGMFVRHWPDKAPQAWALQCCVDPLVVGLTQLGEAQKVVNSQLSSPDPTQGLATIGEHQKTALAVAAVAESQSPSGTKNTAASNTMVKNGVPSSTLDDSMGSKRISVLGTSKASPKKPRSYSKTTLKSPQEAKDAQDSTAQRRQAQKRKRDSDMNADIELPRESPVGATEVAGTTSSKLSYLLDKVLELYRDEKIIIFYDSNHIAYYLSQALDLFNIKHLIYANTLSSEIRSKYIVLFDNESSNRVLLMDIKQAAHGLNLSSASRVFFVNPPCRPDVEAQAIKRAHRIGQTRPVCVETLILQGTVEEAIHSRAQKMTRREHLAAQLLEEDESIRGIIQGAKVIPVHEDELSGERQMAPLKTPQQVFGRPGRGAPKSTSLEKEIFGGAAEDSGMKKSDGGEGPKKKRRKGQGHIATELAGHRSDSDVALAISMNDIGGVKQESPGTSIFGGASNGFA